MRILVRADASGQIGTGHVVRTRTLALEFVERGADVTFVCREHAHNMIAALRQDGINVCALPAPAEPVLTNSEYAGWLGVTQHVDAYQTLEAVGSGWNWLIVDHYGLDAQWEAAMRPHVGAILAIDDLANRRHDCELLLDQNYADAPEKRYEELVPSNSCQLLGPRYALLKPEYARTRVGKRRAGPVKRVMVFFGGAVGEALAAKTLAALSAPLLQHLDVDLVLGAAGNEGDPSNVATGRDGNLRIHRGLPHLADLMAEADIAIGAGGSTTWERMCMGLPSVVASVANNQLPTCEALARDGLICYLGPQDGVTVQCLATAVIGLTQGAETRGRMAEIGMTMVDGHGTTRVVDAMTRCT